MISLDNNRLSFHCPEVHDEATFHIDFQRTLRIPDDGKRYPLPPGLGEFPLRHVDDFPNKVPETWLRRGGVAMPMYQSEAMWVQFKSNGYPFAVKIATGKINAVTGEELQNHLNLDPQDYMIIPQQPWLDGYCVEQGVIRQFVACPLGEGFTAEEQITGAAEYGGVQIIVYPMKAERFAAENLQTSQVSMSGKPPPSPSMPEAMGLAPGGQMSQEIIEDCYGLDAWDQRHAGRCFVHLTNSAVWQAITGEAPPSKPLTASDYTDSGFPWFDYYDPEHESVEGAKILNDLKSVLQMADDKGEDLPHDNVSVAIDRVVVLTPNSKRVVKESKF